AAAVRDVRAAAASRAVARPVVAAKDSPSAAPSPMAIRATHRCSRPTTPTRVVSTRTATSRAARGRPASLAVVSVRVDRVAASPVASLVQLARAAAGARVAAAVRAGRDPRGQDVTTKKAPYGAPFLSVGAASAAIGNFIPVSIFASRLKPLLQGPVPATRASPGRSP